MLRSYAEIRNWIASLADSYSFLPEDCHQPFDANYNICSYISDPGTIEGNPIDEQQIFRMGCHDKNPAKSLHQRVAERISARYGKELYLHCHMGKDTSMIANALFACMTQFAPDFRNLMENERFFDTARHIRKLGLEERYPGLARDGQDKTPGMIVKAFLHRGGEAVGVNIWQLLVIGTLIGNRNLHAKCSSDFSRHVLSVILKHSPRAATPGNKIPVRSFNAQTGRQEYVTVDPENRPDFFIRPLEDSAFIESGVLTDCRCDPKTGLLPEDMLHCSHMQRASLLLCCKLWEVPVSFLAGDYSLVPGRTYALHQEETGNTGCVCVQNQEVIIRVWDNTLEEETQVPRNICDDWQEEIKKLGCLVLPMISRPCAAVWDKERSKIGVLLPQEGNTLAVWDDQEHKPTVKAPGDDQDKRPYSYLPYLVKYGEHPEPITALDTIQSIVSIGAEFWLRPHSPSWEELRSKFPTPSLSTDMNHTALRVRINVPDVASPDKTKIYVTTEQRSRKNIHGTAYCKTFPVSPQDLMPIQTEGSGPEGAPKMREIPFILK